MKSEKFLRLVRENQDLPIIPMVDSAVVADNDYGGVCTNNLTRPPQSWMYVEEIETR